MCVSAATWLKRFLVVASLGLLPTALGCGSPTRNFVDTIGDAAPDSGSPGTDSSTGSDARVDMSTDRPTGPDGGGPDVSQGDARDAADASRDLAVDRSSDVATDFAGDPPRDLNTPELPPPDVAVDVDNSPPTIVDTIPAHAAVGVAVGTTLTVDFSKPMNPGTVTVALQPMVPLGPAAWNPAYTSVAFTPPSALAVTTSYTATVTGSDTGGRALSGTTTFSFTTGGVADTTPPLIRATVPADNAVDVPSGTNIVVTFTEPMDVGSVVVTSVPDVMLGMPTFDPQNTEITFTPPMALLPYTDYTITVAGRDPAMNPLGPPTTFRFRTAQPPDTTPPTVVAVAPANGATAVPSNSSIVITFSEAMNVAATTAAMSLAPAVTCTGGWAWNQAGTTATCVPTTPLAYTTLYTVYVAASAADAAGNTLGAAFSSTFTTGAMPDTTPPTILSIEPVDRAVGAARNAEIVVNFSESMDINSAQGAFSITSPIGITGTFAWGAGNTQLVFTPSVQYPYGATISWQVSTAARDAAGNAKATLDAYSFSVIKTATLDLPCIAALDGYINSSLTAFPSNGFVVIGCTSTATQRGFMAFDITSLPASTTLISSATLYATQYNVAGTPYGATLLGNALWRHVYFGSTLEGADYNTPLLVHTGNTGTLSTNATYERKSSIVTLSVRDDFTNRATRGNRSEFLIRFTQDTRTGCATDYAYFYACESNVVTNRPSLSVTYEYP